MARASDDFFPRDLASSTPHIAACAYNSAFLGALAMPDWDMFHSQHPVGGWGAAAAVWGLGPGAGAGAGAAAGAGAGALWLGLVALGCHPGLMRGSRWARVPPPGAAPPALWRRWHGATPHPPARPPRPQAARLHAAARAVSGGAIYVSDKPGAQDFSLLRELVLPDGTVLRGQLPGRPTRCARRARPAPPPGRRRRCRSPVCLPRALDAARCRRAP